jgi:hypothetical protein
MGLFSLVLGMAAGVGTPGGTARAEDPKETATVTGVVLFEGELPRPTTVALRPDMQRATGQKTVDVQPWLVGKDKGLANCVVTLAAKDPKRRVAAKPVANAVLEKDGADYTPRVLVVTAGTTLTYRNKNSLCRCFDVQSSRSLALEPIHDLVPAGSSREVRLDKPTICRVTANLHPHMTAWIHVVDTPFYAVTDREGRFRIAGLPPGEYRVRVWHEEVGWLTKEAGPQEISLAGPGEQSLKFVLTRRTEKKAMP